VVLLGGLPAAAVDGRGGTGVSSEFLLYVLAGWLLSNMLPLLDEFVLTPRSHRRQKATPGDGRNYTQIARHALGKEAQA
jgi:hypothetical protein